MMPDLISAICVSMPSRYGFLQRAVYNFASQDYYDRELIVAIYDEEYFGKVSSWLSSKQHVNIDLSRVRVLRTTDSHVGKQAAEAFKETSGDFIAAWSDDNLSHARRLSSQLAVTKDLNIATVVSSSFYYFYDTEELYVTDYYQPGHKLSEWCSPASLITPRESFFPVALQLSGAQSHWPSTLVRRLGYSFPNQKYHHLRDVDYGFLFMQGVGSDNQRGIERHRKLGCRLPLTWTRDQILARADDIDNILSGYTFHRKTVDVAGRDAAACTISGENIHQWPDWFDSPLPADGLTLNSEGQ